VLLTTGLQNSNSGQKGGTHCCLQAPYESSATEDILKAHKKQRLSMFPFVTSLSPIKINLMG
jgi:hypothetical protein